MNRGPEIWACRQSAPCSTLAAFAVRSSVRSEAFEAFPPFSHGARSGSSLSMLARWAGIPENKTPRGENSHPADPTPQGGLCCIGDICSGRVGLWTGGPVHVPRKISTCRKYWCRGASCIRKTRNFAPPMTPGFSSQPTGLRSNTTQRGTNMATSIARPNTCNRRLPLRAIHRRTANLDHSLKKVLGILEYHGNHQ